jgi:hypothetical protein
MEHLDKWNGTRQYDFYRWRVWGLFMSFLHSVTPRFCLLTLLSVTVAHSADLKKETIDAWNSYVARENAQVKDRARTEDKFLWADADPKRLERLRAGEVVVEPVGEPNPLHIPGGLIHHWIAAVFIPHACLDDVLSVTRDYAHYKDYYKPGVADASTITKSEAEDEFTIRFVNSSVLSRTSLQGNYVSDFVRVSATRSYSTSITTSMHEIRNFGAANEKQYPSNQGSGYIWRLYSTARMENRDGGVLLELEAVALSRDIPGALRWFVDPIVRRVSHESIEKSLTETSAAVHQRLEACTTGNPIMKADHCPQHADHSDFRAEKLSGHAGR